MALLGAVSTPAFAQTAEKAKPEPHAESQAKTQPPPDEELLEFLGSYDSDDEGWNEFLAHRGEGPKNGTPEEKKTEATPAHSKENAAEDTEPAKTQSGKTPPHEAPPKAQSDK